MNARRLSEGWIVVAFLFASACIGPSPQASEPGGVPDASPSMDNAYVRTCEEAVFGDLGEHWRRGELAAGPVVFVGLSGWADESENNFLPKDAEGHYAGAKVLVVVKGGAVATVAIPASERPFVSLHYDPSKFKMLNLYLVSEGDTAVTFQACPDSWTQFNGRFIVAGARCSAIEITASPHEEPQRMVASFANGPCAPA
jgi:hypothetical protein